MTKRIEVLIVDDQPRARQSLKALLATWPQVEGVREAGSCRDALCLVEESCPDVVLMDARMPEMDGIEATRLLKDKWPQVKVIVISIYGQYAAEALVAGADAFVSKGESPQRLLNTLWAVAAERQSKTLSNEEA